MEREPRVLQQRVQILPVKRRHREADERVRGEEDKGKEGNRDGRLNGKHPRAQSWRQIAPKPCGRRAEQCDNQHPKQH